MPVCLHRLALVFWLAGCLVAGMFVHPAAAAIQQSVSPSDAVPTRHASTFASDHPSADVPADTDTKTGAIRGVVRTDASGTGLEGAQIQVAGRSVGTVTRPDGSYWLPGLAPGTYTITVRYVGYHPVERIVSVEAMRTARVDVRLREATIRLDGAVVTAVRDRQAGSERVEGEAVRGQSAADAGALVGSAPGVHLTRRGPLGLDPSVRGLSGGALGTYVDGMRTYAAGPARMDSPFSHVDAGDVEAVEVMKGPYALTWGNGLGAVRLVTRDLWTAPDAFTARLVSSLRSNQNASDGLASVFGRTDRVAYSVSGSWRTGGDYRSGAGTSVQGDYRQGEVRAKAGARLTDRSQVVVSGSLQRQQDVDYPGRLLTANYFDHYSGQVEWTHAFASRWLKTMQVTAYANGTDHGMNNDGKPTAVADPDRMPPFPLLVEVDVTSRVQGGRSAVTARPYDRGRLHVGVDLAAQHNDALRTIGRRDAGMVMFRDAVWPGVRLVDAGAFAQWQHRTNRGSVGGTVRFDQFTSRADSVSTFFRSAVTSTTRSSSRHLSGAVTAERRVGGHWTFATGLGSSVRSLTALERYSDRFPTTSAQTSAEVVGVPSLRPERATQADVWVEGRFERLRLDVNGFVRRIDNYVTLTATDLRKRLPLSPPVVYQYANGTGVFYGGEVATAYEPVARWILSAGADLLWGQDRSADEPAFGIQPPTVRLKSAHALFSGTVTAWSQATIVAEQSHVSALRSEQVTGGYATLDLGASWRIGKRLQAWGGVDNLFDTEYAAHLSALNPYTKTRIAEPGRSLYLKVEVTL